MNQASHNRLDELFAAEPDRVSRLSFEIGGIYFDWSKTHLDQKLIAEFIRRAETMGFVAARDALFAGAVVNSSENRPATHVAERGNGATDEVDLATARRQRMRALVDAIEAGAKQALSDLNAVKAYDPGKPCEIKVEYKWTDPVAKLRYRHGVEILDDRTVVSQADDWWTAWKQFFF